MLATRILMAASKDSLPEKPILELANKDALQRVAEKRTDELVFALCGPIGTPLHDVAAALGTLLRDRFGYKVTAVRLSEFIQRSYQKRSQHKLDHATRFKRVQTLIEEGNTLRREHGASILAELAVKKIALTRAARKESAGVPFNEPARTCHVIDSIKNQKELDLLRSVYGNLLYCIGVFSPPIERWKRLENDGMKLAEIGELIDRDSGEELPGGQTVEETFPEADYFLRVDEESRATFPDRLARFVEIILGTGVRTPTSAESAMYMAATAACNSACLSRQVGAAIVSTHGELMSVGWNDVPKFGGNLYSADSTPDHRCFRWENKLCHNDAEKTRIIDEIVETLASHGVVPAEKRQQATLLLKRTPVKYLLEFSRAVHAEMHAIIMAGHLGKGSLKGCKLFCTTYPCHSCARHIVAAGISEVFFIEPYTKSLATRLHSDAITESDSVNSKLRLTPFDGVAPNRYRTLFEMHAPRKEAGQAITTSPATATVRLGSYIESFPALEAIIVERLKASQMDL